MTYQDALKYLDSFIDYERQDEYDYKKSFKLERMRRFAGLLDNPQRDIKSIHIAGTKGKGSTAAIVHSILKSAGFKAGLYTSPHLASFRERIRINDELISEEDISHLADRIRDAADRMQDEALSFFEVYTALAYLYFKEKRIDFAIYETGLGGRCDATNIVNPLVCSITPISYEHTQKLGNTLKEIAIEKGGIIKCDTICVSAPQERESLEVIKKICEERRSRLILVGQDILFEELDSNENRETFNIFGLFGEYPILEMKLLGQHQVANAATAIGIIEALRFYDLAISQGAIRQGIANVRWDGRLEVVTRNPFVILDGAQNRSSANALAKAVKKIFTYRKLILVLGVSKDKDIIGILDELLPISDSIILTKSKVVERALEPSKIKELIISKLINSTKIKDEEIILSSTVEEALSLARSRADKDDLILITGSLFIVGEARSLILEYSA